MGSKKETSSIPGKSPIHASSVGLIRNLETGFFSPQFHIIYDNKFQTIMGGYANNNEVSEHVWNVLVQGDEDNENRTVERVHIQQYDNGPQLHADSLTTNEVDKSGTQSIDEEVRRRMNDLESIEPKEN